MNGEKKDKTYILKEDDIVTIRQFPSESDVSPTDTVEIILGFATGGLYNIANGVNQLFGGSNWSELIVNKAEDYLKKMLGLDDSSVTNNDELKSYPSVSGSKNVSAKGKPIPLFLGRSFFTPYILSEYTSIEGTDGNTERVHRLYMVGYKDIQVRNFKIGIYPIAYNDARSGVSQNDYTTELSTDIESGYPALVPDSEARIKPSEYEIKLEVRQGKNTTNTSGEMDLYPQEVVEETKGIQLLHPINENALQVYGFSAKNPMKIQLQVQFQGLVKYNDDGDKQKKSVEVGVQFSYDGGETWNPLGSYFSGDSVTNRAEKDITVTGENSTRTSVTTFSAKKLEQMRFVCEREFTWREINPINGTFTYTENGQTKHGIKNNRIEIRIHKYSTDTTESSKEVDKVYLTKIRTWTYDEDKSNTQSKIVPQVPMIEKYRDRTCRVAFSFKTGDELKGTTDEFNLEATSKAPTWNGTSWSATYNEETNEYTGTLNVTNNPASLMLLILQGQYRGNKRYKNNKIDFDALASLYEYCNTLLDNGKRKFQCNGVLIKKQKTSDVLKTVLDTCRSAWIINGNKYSVLTDKPKTTPTMIINAQNCLSATNNKTFDTLPDGYQCKFINALLDYQEDTVDIWFNDTKETLESVEYLYDTDVEAVRRHAWSDYLKRKYRRETWTRKMSTDAKLLEVGNLVEVQDDSIVVGVGNGAEVLSLIYDDSRENIIGIHTDGSFNVTSTTEYYGIRLMQTVDNTKDIVYIRKLAKFSTKGIKDDLYFDSPIPVTDTIKPSVGDILSFGFYGLEKQDSIVSGKTDNNDETYTVTFVPYDSRIYSVDENTSTYEENYPSKLTNPMDNGIELSGNQNAVNIDDLNTSNGSLNAELKSRYSNHVITLYKKSESQLTRDDLPQVSAVYNFSNNTLEFNGSSNGWTDKYSELEGNGTEYITTACAFGQDSTDTIESAEWENPMPKGLNGENGYNTYTIQLFKRSSVLPSAPTDTLIYSFETNSLNGDLAGWKTSVPEVDEDNNPCWEIHATALSTEKTTAITTFSIPTQILKDSNLTIADVQELISNQASSPVVYAEKTFIGFATDNKGVTLINQSVTIPVKVVQTNEEIDFNFGTLELPSGFSYTIEGDKITISVQKGTVITSGNINIPVLYYPYIANVSYTQTDNGSVYFSSGNIIGTFDSESDIPSTSNDGDLLNFNGTTAESDKSSDGKFYFDSVYKYDSSIQLWKKADITPYGYNLISDNETVFNLGIGYTQVQGGRNLAEIDSVSDIPAQLIIGDYMIFTGDTVDSELVEGGKFKKSYVYIWNGSMWEEDNTDEHIMVNLNAILESMENLPDEEKNDKGVQFIDTLATKTLLADKVYANNIFSNKFESIDSDITEVDDNASAYTKTALESLGLEVNEDRTIIEGSKISTGLINASALIIGDSQLGNVLENKADSDSVPTKVSELTNDSDFATKTESESYAEEVKVVATQTVYSSSLIENYTPNAPTVWIPSSLIPSYYVWQTKPYIDSSVVALFTCVQTKLSNGTFINSEVTKDRTYSSTKGVTIIEGGKIATGLVTADSIEAGAITSDNISSNAITSDKLKSGSVTTDKLNFDDTLQVGDNLSITKEGLLTANDVNVSGNINANTIILGDIINTDDYQEGTGWNIGGDYSGSTNYHHNNCFNFKSLNINIKSQELLLEYVSESSSKTDFIANIINKFTYKTEMKYNYDNVNYSVYLPKPLDNTSYSYDSFFKTETFDSLLDVKIPKMVYMYRPSRKTESKEINFFGVEDTYYGDKTFIWGYFNSDGSLKYVYVWSEEQLPTLIGGFCYKAYEEVNHITFANLPTAQPSVKGQIWNDNGTLKIVP